MSKKSIFQSTVEPALSEAMADYLAHLGDCRPLQSRIECDAASAIVDTMGMPPHHDAQKNWDMLKAVSAVVRWVDKSEPVLDAGAGVHIVSTRWLYQLGYRQLYGCDLKGTVVKPRYAKFGLKVSAQDLTKTDYPDNFFGAVTCISVIEHNVPLQAFAKEMGRIIKPGGVLAVSTDYWPDYIDCSGIYPYGEEAGEMKIFDRKGIEDFVAMCEAGGLELVSPLQLDAQEKAIRWERTDRDYTFMFLAFRRR